MTTVLPHPALVLGEGPRWDAEHRRLLLVDILGGVVLDGAVDGDLRTTRVDGYVGCVAPVRGRPETVVAGVDDGVVLLTLGSGALEALARPEASRRGAVRMNDGACDPEGRFVVGSMAYDAAAGAGRLHRVAPDGRAEVLLDGCTIPNGLVWTDGGATMLHVDSGPKTVTAYPYGDGPLGPGRVLYRHEGEGIPDGICADAAGDLWVAFWGEGVVRRISSSGEVLDEHWVEATQPTACCFTGDPHPRLLVTSAALDLAEPTQADGRTVALDVGVSGPAATPFALA
jgi:sugar lactone lactonase YvrE